MSILSPSFETLEPRQIPAWQKQGLWPNNQPGYQSVNSDLASKVGFSKLNPDKADKQSLKQVRKFRPLSTYISHDGQEMIMTLTGERAQKLLFSRPLRRINNAVLRFVLDLPSRLLSRGRACLGIRAYESKYLASGLQGESLKALLNNLRGNGKNGGHYYSVVSLKRDSKGRFRPASLVVTDSAYYAAKSQGLSGIKDYFRKTFYAKYILPLDASAEQSNMEDVFKISDTLIKLDPAFEVMMFPDMQGRFQNYMANAGMHMIDFNTRYNFTIVPWAFPVLSQAGDWQHQQGQLCLLKERGKAVKFYPGESQLISWMQASHGPDVKPRSLEFVNQTSLMNQQNMALM